MDNTIVVLEPNFIHRVVLLCQASSSDSMLSAMLGFHFGAMDGPNKNIAHDVWRMIIDAPYKDRELIRGMANDLARKQVTYDPTPWVLDIKYTGY